MGWFDEQIRQRKQSDEEAFADCFADMACAVMGQKMAAALKNAQASTQDEIDKILREPLI